jgi:hypothetical protein
MKTDGIECTNTECPHRDNSYEFSCGLGDPPVINVCRDRKVLLNNKQSPGSCRVEPGAQRAWGMTREEAMSELTRIITGIQDWVDTAMESSFDRSSIIALELAIVALEEQGEWEDWPYCPRCGVRMPDSIVMDGTRECYHCGHVFKVEARYRVKKEG